MNWKETYTRIFLKQLGKTSSDAAIKEYLPIWWQNTRNKGKVGLRLTDEGMDIVSQLDITTYFIPYPEKMPITTQIVLFLDTFIECPYYLTNKGITVTNEKTAVELTLFSGDLRKYGLNKALTRQKKNSKSS